MSAATNPATPPRSTLASEVADLRAWLREFETIHGRPLRVLHVGNVANNAFLNAKMLRQLGVEAYVVAYGTRHVMATPEWEEIEVRDDHGDDFDPQFSAADTRNYQRPPWFIDGPLPLCAAHIDAVFNLNQSPTKLRLIDALERLASISERLIGHRATYALSLLFTTPRFFFARLTKRLGWGPRLLTTSKERAHAQGLVNRFQAAFPNRHDRLTVEDVLSRRAAADQMAKAFRHFDVVECYSTDPILALITDQRPYIGFEHGTLRHFTMEDSGLHRLTALAYREADHVFITNGDCLAYAKRLAIPRFSPTIHPIDVARHRERDDKRVTELRREIDADVFLFCPTRHDWDIKGTDQFLRALPLIKERIDGRVKLLLVAWGQQVEQSKRLIENLDCSRDTMWTTSMCRVTMIRHLQAADAVFDQMVLPVFGSTAPQSLAAETPVIGSYIPKETAWLIDEPAPILSAFSPEEIANAVCRTLDPDWRADFRQRARQWIDTYHSPDVVVRDHLRAYRNLIQPTEPEHIVRRRKLAKP